MVSEQRYLSLVLAANGARPKGERQSATWQPAALEVANMGGAPAGPAESRVPSLTWQPAALEVAIMGGAPAGTRRGWL